MYSLKITALIENKAPVGFKKEHGLSVFCEYGGKNYLLDTGASDAYFENAKALGINLSAVDTAVLSHGHYDHSGGYKSFFSVNNSAKLFLRAEAQENCYLKIGPLRHYVGIPKDVLKKYGSRFVYVSENKKLADGVWLLGHSTPNLSERGRRTHLYRKTAEGLVFDDFAHEQSLVFETSSGLVILNSCCHGGADNIVSEIKEVFPGAEVAAIIGGFHLMGTRGTSTLGVKPHEVEALGSSLLKLGVKHTYTCHCTGNPANKILSSVMGERVSYFSTGTVIEL